MLRYRWHSKCLSMVFIITLRVVTLYSTNKEWEHWSFCIIFNKCKYFIFWSNHFYDQLISACLCWINPLCLKLLINNSAIRPYFNYFQIKTLRDNELTGYNSQLQQNVFTDYLSIGRKNNYTAIDFHFQFS